ncbi:MAG: M3 family metallopeptidase [Cyanobacteria bacterium REEB67]|nr:M3 family metallopeptidase [Cyanobacteria bacterium REEB67]
MATKSLRRPATKRTAPSASIEALLAPWTGKHGGLPRFDAIKTEDFKTALLEAIDLKRKEIWAITHQKTLPTFKNTIEALEDSGRHLGRAWQIFSIYTNVLSNDAIQAIDTEMSPILAAAGDELLLDEALFHRIKAVWLKRHSSGLNAEQIRLTESLYENFMRNGAELDAEQKGHLKAVNEKLANLYTKFSQNLLADESGQYLVLDSEDQLAGLPESLRDAAAAAAEERGLKGKWIISNGRSFMDPFLTFSARRELREKAFKMFVSRGDNGDANDNNSVITQILQLRAESAKILGFESYAHWRLAGNMAQHPDAAMELMLKLWKSAVSRAHEEVADMQKLADGESKDGAKITIEPWDYRYYAEKVRQARYDIDQNLVKEYLQLDNLRDAMFWAAKKVHGITMVKLEGIPVVHPDVTVYEVRKGRKRVGTFYFDPYAREGKRSGAWMEQHRTQERFRKRITPVISNQCNFVKGKPGEPVLISWDDATTLFHEFGHALHGLMSNVTYPSLAGTNVKRDWVELPSQLNERWIMTSELLKKFALHYKTGEPISDELVAKIEKAGNFNMGFDRVEFLASGLYDMKIHLAATPDKPIDAGAFERATMAELGCPKEIVMRHRPTQFGHIFGGDGYSAGYYCYLWADAIVADAAEAFEEAGFYDPATCKRLHDTIISVGDSVAPEQAYRNFRGRDIDAQALMRSLGFDDKVV